MTATLNKQIKLYLIVTGNYWAFTLTDGALRMLVVLYFHQLGYSPINIALLFLFYEAFGVVTNLFGGYLGARLGLNRTMNAGLLLQVVALFMLTVPNEYLTVLYVMVAQALSGIAKDLNKMSAKSAVKPLVSAQQQGTLFKWVAILTGSKNALKGVGFFLGGLLLTAVGFTDAMAVMAAVLLAVWAFSVIKLDADLGKAKNKPKFSTVFSKSRSVNVLSAARLFLFAARDVWFVVALPVYLSQQFTWQHWSIGAFLAFWIIGYGFIQSITPKLIKLNATTSPAKQTFTWAALLALVTLGLTLLFSLGLGDETSLIVGLFLFGAAFAVNSSLHSYLIVSFADVDGVSLDVGFYYMANAAGRLAGTVLSGWVFQQYGFAACLAASTLFIVGAALISRKLPSSIK